MHNWYQEVYLQWPLALQLLAWVSLGLNLIVALWLWYDVQRYDGRLNPFSWALGAVACAFFTLGIYWFRTGSPRAAMAFSVTMLTAVILTGFYNNPIQKAVDLQMEHTMQLLPVPGMPGADL